MFENTDTVIKNTDIFLNLLKNFLMCRYESLDPNVTKSKLVLLQAAVLNLHP